jgi:predicted amidohydrolase
MALKCKSLFTVKTRLIASLRLMGQMKLYVVVLASLGVFCSQNVGAGNIKSVKVAICQIQGIDSDREGNFIRIENAISEAKNQKAQIACFPETIILGWVNPTAHEDASEIPGKDSDRLCHLAKANEIFLCIGLAEKSGGKLYDSALLIDDQGKILLKHRKCNILDWLMNPPYTPGDSVRVIDTRYGKIGILICADTFTFEPWTNYLEKMAQYEPDLIIVPYGWAKPVQYWPDTGKDFAQVVIHAAHEIGAPVIGTNLVGMISNGSWTGSVYGGQSIAVDENGKILASCKDRDRDIKVVSISVEQTQ